MLSKDQINHTVASLVTTVYKENNPTADITDTIDAVKNFTPVLVPYYNTLHQKGIDDSFIHSELIAPLVKTMTTMEFTPEELANPQLARAICDNVKSAYEITQYKKHYQG